MLEPVHDPQPDPLVTYAEAAAATGKTADWIRKQVQRGRIRLAGSRISERGGNAMHVIPLAGRLRCACGTCPRRLSHRRGFGWPARDFRDRPRPVSGGNPPVRHLPSAPNGEAGHGRMARVARVVQPVQNDAPVP